mmetsp:Transcript_8553/g.18504  ORF Transcript_8553/g.18504 Transcript_8553/m.18504 type:complete len:214 (-) Transcript_8553:1008-1649(-)
MRHPLISAFGAKGLSTQPMVTHQAIYKFCHVTANAHIPRKTFITNGNFLPIFLVIISNPNDAMAVGASLPPPLSAVPKLLTQAFPFKYSIPYTNGTVIFNRANMDAFSPCSCPCGAPNSVARDVMAVLVPTCWQAPYRPMHPAIRAWRCELPKITVSGKNMADRMAKREKVRRLIYCRMNGRDMLEKIPMMPNTATRSAKPLGCNPHSSLANN